MSIKRQNILIDIECLVDTRFGLIRSRFLPMYTHERAEAYLRRTDDALWNIFPFEREHWEQAWASRDDLDMRSAEPTKLLIHLREIIGPKLIEGLTSPVHDELKLFINVAPYKMSNEAKEMVIASVREWVTPSVSIEAINIPLSLLTPALIKDNYDSVFMYEFEKWLLTHYEALKESRMPTVTFQVPMLTRLDDELAELDVVVDPAIVSRQVMAEYLSYDPLSVDLFTTLPQCL